jgi:hypothetical protein
MGLHPYITSETPRGKAEERVLAAIARAWPDNEVHYLFGGFVVLPKGTPVTCASTLETLWEKLMTGPSPANPVAGSVLLDELTEGPS